MNYIDETLLASDSLVGFVGKAHDEACSDGSSQKSDSQIQCTLKFLSTHPK
jgi:hypothetical protein